MDHSLFRKDAINSARHRLEGDLLVAEPVPLKVLFFLFCTILIAVLVYMVMAQYSRHIAVYGFVELDVPSVRLYAPSNGFVEKLALQSGDPVAERERILEIRYSHPLANGETLLESGEAAVARQRTELEKQAELELAAIELEVSIAVEARRKQEEQLILLAEQLSRVRERLTLLVNRESDAGKLLSVDAISRIQLEQITEQRLLVEEQLDALAAKQAELEAELELGAQQIQLIETRRASTQARFQRELSEIDQRLNQHSGQYIHQVVSPLSGHLDLLTLREGQSVKAGQLVAVVVPEQAGVGARLLIPARTGGSVRVGQSVSLRVDAFPYQQFGFLRGTIKSISASPLMPGEGGYPVAMREPAYEAVVRIADSGIGLQGWGTSLREGMTLSANIELERHSLLNWALAPLRAWHRESWR